MELNFDRNSRPESSRKFLSQQVQEQSSLCDVVVKMRYWEKRFHRCVLVMSPFFDHVLNDNFLEKETGTIYISIGTPVTLETAIMFLYGKTPKFNQENIENILDMAEFLLIPNLKSACIAWLKSVTITTENCLRFLQLSSLYDFKIPKCTVYIAEHLPEMLLDPQMVNLTKDSIHLLFSDKRLSYTPMDDKLSFLLKWSDAKPDTRKSYMQELLSNIDFREISQSHLQKLIHNPEIADFIKVHQPSTIKLCSHRVLITKSENNDGTFWCLDLERDQWFRIESESYKEERSYYYKHISGTCTKNSQSLICFFDKVYQRFSILMVDFSTDTCSKINVIGCDKLKRINDLKIHKDVCVFSVNDGVEMKKKLGKSSELMHRQISYLSVMTNYEYMLPVYIKTSTLHIGHIDEGNIDIELTPLLSFKGDEILQFSIGQNAIVIIFKSRKYVSIYDFVECSLERLEQATKDDDKLAQFKDGYLIYNNKRCISITRAYGSCVTNKYEIAEIAFEQNKFYDIKYLLCGQMAYRYYRKSNEDNSVFECIPLHAVLSRKPEELFLWKQLPLPKEAKQYYSDPIKDTCFEICLPKDKLRCNIECPHCKKLSREPVTKRCTHRYDKDDYIYGDSSDDVSDDDFYNPSYYNGDGDYDCYSDY